MSIADRIEILGWSDPERALRALQSIDRSIEDLDTDIPLLEVQGEIYADMHQQADVDETSATLHAIATRGNRTALLAERFVRAYSSFERAQYAAASANLSTSDIADIKFPTERFRFLILKGNSLRLQKQTEAASPVFEQAYALARDLRDDSRTLHAILLLARLEIASGQLRLASTNLGAARKLAASSGDEAALADVESCASLMAEHKGDRAAERRASLSALEHANRSGSSKWMSQALIDLGDSYLRTRDFRESLKYSQQALLIPGRAEDRDIALFNEGEALIGLGKLKAGRERAERAINDTLASDDLSDAEDMLREYADSLEQAGYLVMAIDVYRRHDELEEKLISRTRQLAFELSAKADSERHARDIELLRRDAALKAAELQEQRLRQQLALAAALFITCICAALIWAFIRVRTANERLRNSSEIDALTGLRNRRFFNDHILPVEGARPTSGCVLLADIDYFKQVNDTFGHPAGDAVLATVSQRLAATLRASDKLVRWGGEEFLAVLDSVTPEQADLTVARLLAAVRQAPIISNGQPIPCTISIGYACFPMPGTPQEFNLEAAIRLVDKALYEAKHRGRDRACRVEMTGRADIGNPPGVSPDWAPADTDLPIHFIDMSVAA